MKTITISKRLLTASLFILGVAFSHGAYADTKSPYINKIQKNQKHRILNGVKSGVLTAKETARLTKQQVRIHNKEKEFKADGVFTRKERFKIRSRQFKASKNIYIKKHNGRKNK